MRFWIQRGHCFRRSGSTGTTGEQAYVDRVAKDAAGIIGREHHVRVALADEPVQAGYDLFIALHCDGSVSSSASGASVGYRTARGRNAAHLWKRRFVARGWPFEFRGDNYTAALAGYYGTGWAEARGIPAFILEHGFLTNPTRDRRWLTSGEGRAASAHALADVMRIYAGGTPTPDGTIDEEDTMGTLARGMDGAGVGDLQDDLNAFAQTVTDEGIGGSDLPHLHPARPEWYPLKVDDDYGPATEAAVSWSKDVLGYTRPGSGGRYAPEGFQRRLAIVAYGNHADARAERRNDQQWTAIADLRARVERLELP